MQNSQKGLSKPLLFILIATILIAGGYFIWSKNFAYSGTPSCEDSQFKPDAVGTMHEGQHAFRCYRAEFEENECLVEYFNLATGKKISSEETPCAVY